MDKNEYKKIIIQKIIKLQNILISTTDEIEILLKELERLEDING